MSETVQILLVEDDDIDQMALKRAFKQLGISNPVRIARDGLEALAILRGHAGHEPLARPHVILLDLNMPRMNGIEFLREIRSDDNLHDSIVFILTTSKAEEDKVEAYRLNVAGYIVKSDVGNGFLDAVGLLEHYWKVIELP